MQRRDFQNVCQERDDSSKCRACKGERDAEDGGERADVRVVLRVVVDQEAMEIQDEGCSHVLQKRAGVH